jgi:hypothetical protein
MGGKDDVNMYNYIPQMDVYKGMMLITLVGK